MNNTIRKHLDNLYSKNAEKRYASFLYLQDETKEPVTWVNLAWDDLLALLHGDNHQRAIGAQLLSSLAKSAPGKMANSLESLMRVTYDNRFVTARHAIQALWKVGIASEGLQEEITKRLSKRFAECSEEKNCTLIRYDIVEVFWKMYNHTEETNIKDTALILIESETDEKYRKKYLGLWRDVVKKETVK